MKLFSYKKILYLFIAFFSASSINAKTHKVSGVIYDYECGDSCYLVIKDKRGAEIYGLCFAPICSAWNDSWGMPEKFKGRNVEATLGKRTRLDGAGNVMDQFMSFEKIKFLGQSKTTPYQLSKKEIASAFLAAGYKLKNGKWRKCGKGSIEEVRDLNQDGLPEVLITSDGMKPGEMLTYCYGNTGTAFSLLSKSSNGKWKLLMDEHVGIPRFLKSTSYNWPDIEVGGPGFCFPVWRWNGQKYQMHREQDHEGKYCERFMRSSKLPY